MGIRIISLNIGATIKVPGYVNENGETVSEDDRATIRNLEGISRFLQRKAAGSVHTVIGLQEVENYILRSAGINQPLYFSDQMGAGWSNVFQRLVKPGESRKLKLYDGSRPGDGPGEYKNGQDTPGLGNAVISNIPIIKTADLRYNFNPNQVQAIEGLVYQYGFQQKGALGVKLALEGKYMWLINTHFILELHAIERQVWQVLGLAGSMDPMLPIVIMGDFNIWQNGLNGYDVTDESREQHRILYQKMCSMFEAAGFVQLGEDAGNSFKPWSMRSRIDYCFLLNPPQYASSVLTLNRFRIARPRDENADPLESFTDHCALVMDFDWNLRALNGNPYV